MCLLAQLEEPSVSDYRAPLNDLAFLFDKVVGLHEVFQLPAYAEVDADVVPDLLTEAGRFMADKMAPLNRVGDTVGCKVEGEKVVTPPGFREAYKAYVEAGWGGVSHPEEFGGGSFPVAVGLAVQEFFTEANVAFSLCPLLGQGAIELMLQHGDETQKEQYLTPMISGEWTGTMNLTESEAGSDVGAVRAKAEPVGDGSYRITGNKIFISWGEHDCVENIIHLVLARIPGAPAGTKGITCFVVPKFLPDAEGKPGVRNDLKVVSIEHKMGINASPTCVMSFGDKGGAIGWPIGGENRGMAAMFTMMNHARLTVGMEGLALMEASYQTAADYARERKQGRAIGGPERQGPAPIVDHADVRRMLMTMRSTAAASRFLIYEAGIGIDRSHHEQDSEERKRAADRVALLIPLCKAWSTDMAEIITSMGVQVHGGVGYIEETGVAQFYRDAKIASIYEGTNGIQAADLVFRKLSLAGGAAIAALFADIEVTVKALADREGLEGLSQCMADALGVVRQGTQVVNGYLATDQRAAAAASTPYLHMLGTLVAGWGMARSALAAATCLERGEGDSDFLADKLAECQFFIYHLLGSVSGCLATVTAGLAEFDTIPAERL